MSQKIELEKTVGYLFPEKIFLFKNKEEAFQYYPYSHKETIKKKIKTHLGFIFRYINNQL